MNTSTRLFYQAIVAAMTILSFSVGASQETEVSLSGPDTCVVKGMQMPCTSVASYLRDTLHLPPKSNVTVTWSFYQDPETHARKVSAALKDAGYTCIFQIGFREDPLAK